MIATHHISNDFNGDSKSDVLWRNDDGRGAAWLGSSTGAFTTSWPNLHAGPGAIATGDFNGDGVADIVTSGPFIIESARNGTWFPNYESAASVVGWTILGAGDFNGDGYSDILFRNDSTGAISNWLGYTDPTDLNFLGDPIGLFKDNVANAGNSVSADWKVAGIGDFNGDGKSDLLWRNDDGRLTNWLGTTTGGYQPNSINMLDTVSTDWKVDGVGDFNGDGKSDILWRNIDGRISVWLGTSNGAFTDNVANAYNSVSLDWHVADIGDFNGDGRADILWRNDDGRVTDWLGSAGGGLQPNSANALYSPSADWHVVPHDGFFHF